MKTNVCVDVDGKRYAVYISKTKIEVETDGVTISAEGVELRVNGRYYDAVKTERESGRVNYFLTVFGSAIVYFGDNQVVIALYDKTGNCFWECHAHFPVDIQGLTTITISGTVKLLTRPVPAPAVYAGDMATLCNLLESIWTGCGYGDVEVTEEPQADAVISVNVDGKYHNLHGSTMVSLQNKNG